MTYRISTSKYDINGSDIQQLLFRCGMGTYTPDLHQKAFENSYKFILIFAQHSEKLIGCARMISDGCYQAAIYDVAILPEYQGTGLGRIIIEALLKDTRQLNIVLYSSPGKESFYQKFNFRLGKTAMLKFLNPGVMQVKGFTE